MSFFEERFPDDIAVGAEGGPEWLTQIVAQLSGFEQRNAAWPVPRRRYTVTLLNRDADDTYQAMSFMLVIAVGRANGFRFKDFLDFEAEAGDGLLGTGIATGSPTYQLVKRYTYSVYTHDRDITKPVAGTVIVERSGYPAVVGGSPLNAGEIEINTVNGVVTFGADAIASVVQVGVGATTVVELDAQIGLAVGQKMWVTGVGGTAGEILNDAAWTVLSIGSPASSYVLQVSTSGTTWGGGGTGAKYPQASETLTWTGEFDVPCRFDIDRMRAAVTVGGQPENRRATWDSIEIIEIRPRDDE